MSTTLEKEEIRKLLDELIAKKKLVLVEGIKDKRALAKLGVVNVVTLARRPLFEVVEDIAERTSEVVLLVDLDEEGRKLYHALSVDLQKNGVKIDNKFREFLFKTSVRQVEGLASYLA
ncbi:MAG TPA: toprim domain-containing protein [Candidatus Nanoarchaeia archaeon]|nr:toprim domain-containing protein [Candidatus Nanoarchaeia archaeon]